jgi:hypothetical protein
MKAPRVRPIVRKGRSRAIQARGGRVSARRGLEWVGSYGISLMIRRAVHLPHAANAELSHFRQETDPRAMQGAVPHTGMISSPIQRSAVDFIGRPDTTLERMKRDIGDRQRPV